MQVGLWGSCRNLYVSRRVRPAKYVPCTRLHRPPPTLHMPHAALVRRMQGWEGGSTALEDGLQAMAGRIKLLGSALEAAKSSRQAAATQVCVDRMRPHVHTLARTMVLFLAFCIQGPAVCDLYVLKGIVVGHTWTCPDLAHHLLDGTPGPFTTHARCLRLQENSVAAAAAKLRERVAALELQLATEQEARTTLAAVRGVG